MLRCVHRAGTAASRLHRLTAALLLAPIPRTTPAVRSFAAAASGAGTPAEGAGVGSGAPSSKPRAASGAPHAKKKRHYLLAALLGGPLAFLGYLAYTYKSPGEAAAALTDLVKFLASNDLSGDPTRDDLLRALGPPVPDFYINVLIALEDVLVRREWDRKYGWRYEVRPGVKEMLKSALESGAMVTFWSDASSGVATDMASRLSLEFGMALPVTPLHVRVCGRGERMGAMHPRRALTPRHPPPLLQLGSEHTFARPGETKREKHIEFFNRGVQSILLVDHDSLSETFAPGSTVLVKSWTAAQAEGGARPDTAMAAISSLISRIRADAAAGEVNVPRTLAALRGEAVSRGFSTDAAGLSAFMEAESAAANEADAARLARGLGGLLRAVLGGAPLLRGRYTTGDVAATRPYRDPSFDVPADALLAVRVHAANSRLDAAMQGQQVA